MREVAWLLVIVLIVFGCPGKTKVSPAKSEPGNELMSTPTTPTVAAGQDSLKVAPASREVSFRNDVLPIIRKLAADCHTAEDPAGNYVLDSYEDIMAGGSDSIPNVIPGKPDSSLLLIYLMKGHPFGKKPAPEQLEVIREWILQGAKNN
uniref:Cytochrome C Planctomycete-type domain-containing protein n=1 Tax=candidate division WOR-3 bacterium TaxID=2052148 RepID=A0A7V3PUL6_UNCW3